jgi:hypothetical protein
MNAIHYIGFDVHKKTISFCVKTAAGLVVEEGTLEAERTVLRRWAAARKRAWHGAMEATIFSAWIYDTLQPFAQQLTKFHEILVHEILERLGVKVKMDDRSVTPIHLEVELSEFGREAYACKCHPSSLAGNDGGVLRLFPKLHRSSDLPERAGSHDSQDRARLQIGD